MKRIIIDVKRDGFRAALLDGGEPVEFICDKTGGEKPLPRIGEIYLGTVESVTKNGFVFIDAGIDFEKRFFLNLNDRREDGVRLKNGDIAAVQVIKDASGGKGAYVTRKISCPGRFIVLEANPIPGSGGTGIAVSSKITDEVERKRLKGIVSGLLENSAADLSVIIRTEAENRAKDELQGEFNALFRKICGINAAICERTEKRELGLIYKPFKSRAVEAAIELASGGVKEIVVNNRSEFDRLTEFYRRAENSRYDEPDIIFYDETSEITPIFSSYGLEHRLGKVFDKKVWLDCGGYIMIEKTEACVVIDVNSGKYEKKKHSLEEMSYRVNLEAAAEIARQLRLRNLSGVIIADFIGMSDPAHTAALEKRLAATLAKDRVQANAVGMTRLGLMEITRKRTRNPLSAEDLGLD